MFIREKYPLFIFLWYLTISSFSCQESDKSYLRTQAIEDILKTEKSFCDMAKTSGVKEAFLFYAAPGVVLQRNNSLIEGKEEMVSFFDQNNYPSFILEWSPVFADASLSGDLGYTYGPYSYQAVNEDGDTLSGSGIFHTVWKKQTDGSWRFVYD